MLLKSKLIDAGEVERLVMRVGGDYAHNLTSQIRDDGQTRDGRFKVRFTIAVSDSFGPGARTSASGRHMPKASWQAHRDVMRTLFAIDPEADLQTALATYRGAADFESKFEVTGDQNCGSNMEPMRLRDTAV